MRSLGSISQAWQRLIWCEELALDGLDSLLEGHGKSGSGNGTDGKEEQKLYTIV